MAWAAGCALARARLPSRIHDVALPDAAIGGAGDAVKLRGWIIVALLAASCRAETSLDGESLRCQDACPEGLRCFEGVCIVNTPARIEPLASQQAVAGRSFSARASASDADGDGVRIVWTQVDGPSTILAEPIEGEDLSATLDGVGLYTFEVAGDDGFELGPAQRLAVTSTNRAPVLAALDDVYALVGDEAQITASAEDPDGHPVSFEWVQKSGPVVVAEPRTGATLTFTTAALGVHTFEVTADDGWEASAPAALRVVVEPGAGTTYVSATGSEGPTCGSVDEPCASLGAGLAAMRAAGGSALALAAADLSYHDCLDLRPGEQLYGAMSAATWQHDAPLRTTTRIVCDQGIGHRVAGDGAVLRDVTLASSFTAPADASPTVVTLLVDDGAPSITGVDVEGAACGEGCMVFGIASFDASPMFRDVNVRGATGGFDAVYSFVGLYALGGAPVFEGTTSPRTLNDGARGRIALSGPADLYSIGVISARSDSTLRDVAIVGGLGRTLVGVAAMGGAPLVEGVVIDLAAFGTSFLGGVQVGTCVNDGFPCQCPGQGITCVEPPVQLFEPAAVVRDNLIELQGSLAGTGPTPCLSTGVFQGGDGLATSSFAVRDNRIALRGAHGFAVGVLTRITWVGTSGATIADNDIVVETGRSSPLCETLVPEIGGISQGNVGVLVEGGTGVEVVGNDVAIAGHDRLSVGLYGYAGRRLLAADNRIVVAATPGAGEPVPTAIGAATFLSIAAGPEDFTLFDRNDVRIGAGFIEGVALWMDGSQQLVRNNFLSGGDALYATALVAAGVVSDPTWPRVYHNTLYAGGWAGETLVSRGALLALSLAADPTTGLGVMVHNLVDGGDAVGRRYVLDDDASSSAIAASGNVGQLAPVSTAPAPSYILSTGSQARNETGFGPAPGWAVVLAGSGQIIGVDHGGATELRRTNEIVTRGAPSAAWDGGEVGLPGLVLVVPGALGVAAIDAGGVQAVVRHVPHTSEGQRRVPDLGVLASVNGDARADVLFLERGTGALYQVLGDPMGGFQAAELVTSFVDPRFIDVEYGGGSGYVLALDATGAAVVQPFAVRGGLRLGAPLPIASFTGVATELDRIERFAATRFFGPPSAGEWTSDFVLVIDGALVVALQGAQGYRTAPFSVAPCSASGRVTAFAVADVLTNLPAGAGELVVGCADGAVELFAYNGITSTFGLAGSHSTASEVSAIGAAPFDPTSAQVLVAHAGPGTPEPVQRFRIHLATGVFTAAGSLSILADVVHRPGGDQKNSWTGDPAELTYYPPGDPGACSLAFRDGGDAGDLHLSASALSCIDQSAVAGSDDPELEALTGDIDGARTRSDGLLDVGADEF